MQTYPAYYPSQYPYSPMLNPQQRLAQMEQMYPQFSQQNLVGTQMSLPQQPIGLNCRIVDDFNAISANDVPMDGNGAIFMKRDGSEMQWRVWTATGQIATTQFKPIQQENIEQGTNMPQINLNALNEDVRALREDILSRLDDMEKAISSSAKATPKTKKGADEE